MSKFRKMTTIVVTVALLLCTTMFWLYPLTYAQELEQLPERPPVPERPTMPDRPSEPNQPVPAKPAEPMAAHQASGEDGAWIELQITPPLPTNWTEVEWEDSTAGWHLVEGWRGHSRQGTVRWFVQQSDFGKGPFRWQAYEQTGSIPIARSEKFYLPKNSKEVVMITLAPQTEK